MRMSRHAAIPTDEQPSFEILKHIARWGSMKRRRTSRQPNTHSIESREVRYPWHPWCGRSVWISEIQPRHRGTMYRCTIELSSTVRAVEIPEWMFDAAACAVMRLAPAPVADVEALLQLKHLLSAV